MAKRKVQTARRIRANRAGAFRRYLGTDSGKQWADELARGLVDTVRRNNAVAAISQASAHTPVMPAASEADDA